MLARRRLALLLTALAALVIPGSAQAYFTAGGAGTGAGTTRSLAAAAVSVPGSAVNNVTVTWTAQAALAPPDAAQTGTTYKVQRKLGAGAYADVVAGGCSGNLPYNTPSCMDTPGAAGSYTYRAVATYESWTATSADAGPVTVTLDGTPPTVSSINRAGATPTNAAGVSWTVTFSESVTGVDASDFALANSGLTGPSITSVSGSGSTRTVTVSTGSGAGTLGLNLGDDDSIADAGANKLGGTGAGNGNFTGQVYSVDRVAPTATITRAGTSPTNAASVTWNVVFSETVTGVGTSDFTLVRGGSVTGGSVTGFTGSGTNYTVTASTGSGSGTLGLDLPAGATITDAVGNTPTAATGAVYTIDKTAPALASMIMRDNDNDGKVDRVVATFNETLASSTLTSQWTLANVPSAGSLSSVSTSGAVATLILTEGAGAANTAVGTFTLALAANASGIRDAFGHQSSFAATAPSDGSGPVPISIVDSDTTGTANGTLEAADTMTIGFTEAIASGVPASPTITEARPASGNATLTITGITNGALDMSSANYVAAANNSFTFSATTALANANRNIVVTAGSCTSGCAQVDRGNGTSMTFVPAPTLLDAAGNGAVGAVGYGARVF